MILATIKSGNHDLTFGIPFERERLAQSLSELQIGNLRADSFSGTDPGKNFP